MGKFNPDPEITGLISSIPYRMALAGGWIDQPFMSKLNPTPPGSMVVVRVKPRYLFMERSGMGTSTRKVANELWNGTIPDGDPARLVRELYFAENKDAAEPSGSQDMAGIIYPGVSRLDFDYDHDGGLFPVHVESNTSSAVAQWLERVIHIVPVAKRPAGYNPLETKNLDPEWIGRLGQTGQDCFDAIVNMNSSALGASMNECMICWETLLPDTVRHSTITIDLADLLRFYQSRYVGAMYSGCGGGYLYVISENPVPGAFRITVHDSTGRSYGSLMNTVVISGAFDDLRFRHVRFLQEAAKFGQLHLRLWSDEICRQMGRNEIKFSQDERLYFLSSIRYLERVDLETSLANPHTAPQLDGLMPDIWVVHRDDHDPRKQLYCQAHGIAYGLIGDESLSGYPKVTQETPENEPSSPKKVLVTGCYDWLHSGHVRFFEETSALGELYVVVGHDENVRTLKGDTHPLFSQDERRYMVQAIRYVKEALISTGHGWMDAEPEIARIKPDIYAVNGDGDKPEKRQFCAQYGIEYVVLKRLPKEGLSRRESTSLRGF